MKKPHISSKENGNSKINPKTFEKNIKTSSGSLHKTIDAMTFMFFNQTLGVISKLILRIKGG